MKPFGISIVYIVIAVGVLGVVVFSFVFLNTPAVLYDDTLKCQRTYDFSNVKFTPEAKADWEKCYMSEPLYERRGDGSVYCVEYPELSCRYCALAIAVKYNNSDFCDIIAPCGGKMGEVSLCKSAVYSAPSPYYCNIEFYRYRANFSLISTRVKSVYPWLNDTIARLQDKYCNNYTIVT